MKDTPISRHFARLRELLAGDLVDSLEREYKSDTRAYERKSRERTRQRQAKQRMAREGRQEGDSDG